MKMFLVLAGLFGLATMGPSFAATPVNLDGTLQFDPGKVIKVENWVLCTTEAIANDIAKARSEGVEAALKVYAGYQTAKTCGIFPQLSVILRESLYHHFDPEVGYNAEVFAASVNLGSEWSKGFVVRGITSE